MNRQEQLLELENEIAKANKEIDNLKSGMTPGQMISVIFLFISIFMIFILSGFFVKFFGFILAFLSILGIIGASNQKSERVSWLEQCCIDLECEIEKKKQEWLEEDNRKQEELKKNEEKKLYEFLDEVFVVGTNYRPDRNKPFEELLEVDYSTYGEYWDTITTSNFELVAEPENQVDSNAIKVIVEGYFIGYISRKRNKMLKKYLDKNNYIIGGEVKISGGMGYDTNNRFKRLPIRYDLNLKIKKLEE